MHLSTTIIRKTIKELEKLDKFIQNELNKELKIAEIKAFFIFRHINTAKLKPVQRYLIKQWEPRTAELIEPLTMTEYNELRNWLGIQHLNIKAFSDKLSKDKKDLADYLYKAKEIFDLRDEVMKSASDITR